MGPPTISLVFSDLDSLTAAAAVQQLRDDPALADVRFAIYHSTSLPSADLEQLRRSDVVIIQTFGRGLVRQLEDELPSMAAAGARIYALGPSWDDDFSDFGLIHDEQMQEYMASGGVTNVAHLIRLVLWRDLGLGAPAPPPQPVLQMAYFDPDSGRSTAHLEEFLQWRPGLDQAARVGILFYRTNALSTQTATVKALADDLEAQGLKALPVFGYPNEAAIRRFFMDADGRSRIDVLIALGLKIGTTPDATIPVLKALDVPVINAITLSNQSRADWEASPIGLDVAERAWQVALAEFGGAGQPTVVASKEARHERGSGQDVMVETPIPERVTRVAERVRRWLTLRQAPAAEKKVAILYYNYPPGKENIGASYLNVLPRSLWQILQRLRTEGFRSDGAPDSEETLFDAIHEYGSNIGNWEPGAVAALAASGRAVLWPVSAYRHYFDRLPEVLRTAMVQAWGDPEDSNIGIWRDAEGVGHFLFPAQQWGNLIFAPQPARGWEQDVKKLYHDVTIPPHHQYLAFYLWLQHQAAVDAMVHVGTHATHEWHSGKEVGYTAADPGEIFAGAVPQLYPYIVDDIGEGLQAKRRGMATLISHQTPPLDRAGLNPELKALIGLISDHDVAQQKGDIAPDAIRHAIAERAAQMGLLTDLGLTEVDSQAIETIEHYIKEVEEKRTPFGLHTFGTAPTEPQRRSTADAILSLDTDLTALERSARMQELQSRLLASGPAELDALSAGLAGRYIEAGSGNDPIRNPEALPTGRNLYGFDPSRLPTEATYAAGAELAEELVADWRARHGEWPKRFVFNLWGVESSRHEGVMEAQILALWGVRPVWDARGRVSGVERIPRNELGRPRVDVTVIPSGLYRDLFAPLMRWLDEAATAARNSPEPDNPIRENARATRDQLIGQGLAEDEAERLSGVRLFSVPSGTYGTNLDKVIPLSNTYDDENAVADVYFMRMSHAYGQGYWGGRVMQDGRVTDEMAPKLGVDLLRMALQGVQAAVHSRSSNIYATLDNDDFYQYLGGTAMAVRQVNGATPEVLVTNMANPRDMKTETLEKYMGREMRSRYLNPQWIEAMLAEGYGGARFINKVVDNLWGWTVTTPDKIDDAKWQEMYETYVVDRHDLGIKDKFRQADNLLAYQALVDRMLTAVYKGYWAASPDVVAHLQQVNQETIAEAGVACYRDTCSSAEIVALAEQQDRMLNQQAQAPGAVHDAAPAVSLNAGTPRQPAAATRQAASVAQEAASGQAAAPGQATVAQEEAARQVQGYEVQEVTLSSGEASPSNEPPTGRFLWLLLLVVAVGAFLRSRLPAVMPQGPASAHH
ncbi:cobaltochelatase subunit CobN [Castellaniella sp.]|uniref:cobaltochelatase subunit CobN n=1 Tax=Castellaniella sp. TaxID=1955812 RepID=UPI00355CC796